MAKPFVFDRPESTWIVQARQAFLQQLLADLKPQCDLKTALDVGCGVGYFSAFLRDLGFQVVALDARPQNIEEARARHPGIDFRVANVEDLRPEELGGYDFVLCFGLLYHLENPMRALRRLRAVTGKLLLVESMSVPGEAPVLYLRDESEIEDQALHSVAAYPSEGALVKMAYRAGFPVVYRPTALPDHEDFRAELGRERTRTVIAASTSPLQHPALALTPEPAGRADLWSSDPAGVGRMAHRFRRFLRLPWQEKWARLRRRYLASGD